MPRSILDTGFRRSDKFFDPFLLPSHDYIPDNWYNALSFALYVAIQHPEYTRACVRTVAHFITDIAFKDTGSEKERSELKDYLVNELHIYEAMRQAGLEMFIYGNSFARIHYPFQRYLIDRRNDGYRKYDVNMFKGFARYNYEKMTYTVPDPLQSDEPDLSKRGTVDLEFADTKQATRADIRIRFIDPKQMQLSMNYISGSIEYIYRFEEFFKSAVQEGTNLQQINETPREMLEAIARDQDFKFNPGVIFHFRNPFISGLSNNGWGIPDILLNYSSIHQIQVLRCINESVGLDYVLPLRLLTPSNSIAGAGSDVMSQTNMGLWKASMTRIIKEKRKRPDALFTVPFPVTYQEASGNGKALAPVDLLKYANEEMLNNAGFAAQLWTMDLNLPQVPTALRLFEATNLHIPQAFNQFLKWTTRNILDYIGQQQMEVELMRPIMADNIEKNAILLQLVAGGEVSRQTGYQHIGIDDPIGEKKRRIHEDIEFQKLQEKANQDFEREMTLGSGDQVVSAAGQAAADEAAAMGGGNPAATGPMQLPSGANMTPLDLEQQAMELAQQLLSMPLGERRKQMNAISASNPTLYALTKQKMEEIRSQGESQGRAQVSAP